MMTVISVPTQGPVGGATSLAEESVGPSVDGGCSTTGVAVVGVLAVDVCSAREERG
jgi:hypothetical protein